MHFLRQDRGITFCDLQHRTETGNQIDTAHGDGHTALGQEAAGEAAAAEILTVCGDPGDGIQALLSFFFADFPEMFHNGIAVFIAHLTGGVGSSGAGVDQVDQTRFRHIITGNALDCFLTPEGTDVGEALRSAGQQVTEQHGNAVESIVFRGKDHGFTDPVPVEGGVEDRFHEVAVGHVIGPLTLSLKTAGNGVMTAGFFHKAHFRQFRIADHQVAGDHAHLRDIIPHFFVAFRREGIAVAEVFTLLAVFPDPFTGFGIFFRIVDIFVDAADDLAHIHRFATDVQILFKEFRIHNGTGDPHRHRADGEIRFPAHERDRDGGTGETEQFFLHVVRDDRIGGILHIPPVDTESGQTFLCVGCEDSRQIDCAGAFRAVEAPDSFLGEGIHIHGFGTIAPAGRDTDGRHDIFRCKIFRTGSCFRHTADGGLCDHTLDFFTVGIAQVGFDQLGCRLRHVHGLIFQGLADAFAAAVNDRSDTDLRHFCVHKTPRFRLFWLNF